MWTERQMENNSWHVQGFFKCNFWCKCESISNYTYEINKKPCQEVICMRKQENKMTPFGHTVTRAERKSVILSGVRAELGVIMSDY